MHCLFFTILARSREITSYTEQDCENHGLIYEPPPPRSPPRDPNDFPNFVAANANIASGLIVSFVNVNTTDDHSGTGWVWGIGEGLDVTGGTLGYGSWDRLKSEQNTIAVVAEFDALTITFFVDGAIEAVYVGAGVGEVTFEGGGHFDWK